MRRILALGATLSALCACSTPFSFGGEDWGGDTASNGTDSLQSPEDTSASADGAGLYVVAAHAVCTDLAGEGLFADVSGQQAWITHDGFATGCGGAWSVSLAPGAPNAQGVIPVAATYTATDSTDCACEGWELEYVIGGLPDGAYRLAAGGQNVSFAVGTTQ